MSWAEIITPPKCDERSMTAAEELIIIKFTLAPSPADVIVITITSV